MTFDDASVAHDQAHLVPSWAVQAESAAEPNSLAPFARLPVVVAAASAAGAEQFAG
jgi:hypothetical protein